MKIMVVLDRAFTPSETFLYQELMALVDLRPIVLCRKRMNRADFPLPKGLSFLTLYDNWIFRLMLKLNEDPYSFPDWINRWIVRIIKKYKIQMVFAEYGPSALRVLPACKRLGVELRVRFHGFDASRLLEDTAYIDRLPDLFGYITNATFPSKFLKSKMEKHGITGEKLEVVYNGVDMDSILNVEAKKSKTLTIVHAGRLVPKKGVPDLIRVFHTLHQEEFPNVKLVIIGKGPDMDTCQNLVKDFDLRDKVELLGAMAHKRLISIVRSAHIFVLNSRVDAQGETEGFPISVLEAMASGLAIVSTYHAGIPEALENEKSGLLVDEANNKQLSEALRRLLSDEILRKKLGENARIRFESHFTKEILHAQLRKSLGVG